MKNHWLKVHEQKKNFWTAEFVKRNMYVLKPRRVGVLNPKQIGFMGSTCGTVNLNFKGGMVASNDRELVDLMIESRKSMNGWLGRIRHYTSSFKETKYYEFSDLHFGSISVGLEIEDIELSFHYDALKQVFCS